MELSSNKFEELILEADRSLEEDNKPIHARPLNAVIFIFNKLHESGPLFNPKEESVDFPVTAFNLSNHIHLWYEKRYGDLLKVDFSPSRFPISINGAIYRCKPPMIVGHITIISSKNQFKDKRILNAVDCIESLPNYVREKLDSSTENLLQAILVTCLETTHEIKAKDLVMLSSAQSDMIVSCEQLLGSNINASLSAWHSLQFVEKTLKTYIHKYEKPKHIHNIEKLKNRAVELGYQADKSINWGVFNFNAEVRYDPSKISVTTALNANYEAWKVGFNVLKQL
ncbi:MAG: hypothetical protein JXQ77_04015 [Campylobacterales bacterium]|nr:hypothetical protein [Campylobacterales bacterium]